MNEKLSIRLGPWYGLLCFGAGSILTVVIATIDSGWGPLSGINPLMGLALAYLALVWAGLFAILMTTPAAVGLIVFLGIASAIGFIAYGIERRPRNQDEGEIFP